MLRANREPYGGICLGVSVPGWRKVDGEMARWCGAFVVRQSVGTGLPHRGSPWQNGDLIA